MPPEPIDVVLLTALHEEYLAVLEITDGALDATWTETPDGPAGWTVARRRFIGRDGAPFTLLATWTSGMGGTDAAARAGRLVERYTPRCLVMTGFAAGRRGKVALGDVVFAHRVFAHDAGKTETRERDGQRITTIKGDLDPYRIDDAWKRRLEEFLHTHAHPLAAAPWATARPRRLEQQADWLLARLLAGDDPTKHPDRQTACSDWQPVVEHLWSRRLLLKNRLALSQKGRTHAERARLLTPDGPPPPAPLELHLGDIANVARVTEDDTIFATIDAAMRKTVGLEMEGKAIATVAHQDGKPWLVAKGICDFADADKDDRYHHFAARAAAECLIAFLRAHSDLFLPPDTTAATRRDAEAALDQRLLPGYTTLPRNPTPIQHLVARYHVVPFTARAAELADLDAWADDPAPISVRLLHAPGGVGKTRLLLEWLHRRRAAGHRAGLARAPLDAALADTLAAAARATLVIDYAESQPDLFPFLRRLAALREAPKPDLHLRVVLLARHAGEWYDLLRQRDEAIAALLADAPTPVALDPLIAPDARPAEFTRAAAAFAEHRKRPAPTANPPLDDPRFARALYLHAAALAAVDGLPTAPDEVLDGLLDHEARFWLQRAGLASDTTEADTAADFRAAARAALAALTLRGGAPDRPRAEAICRPFTDDPRRLARLARDLYPPAAAGWCAPLEPDLLGEALVRRLLTDPTWPDWIDDALTDATPAEWTHAFTLLGRLEETAPALIRPLYPRLLAADLPHRAPPAFAAVLALAERTAHSQLGPALAAALTHAGSIDLARAFDGRLPEHTTMLRELAVWVYETLLPTEPTDEARARRLNNLGNRLSALGRPEPALAATEEAVALYRTLAAARPDAFTPDLAMSLNNLGNMLSALGRPEPALAATEEAVALRRTLAAARPDAFTPDLATSLNNLGNMLSALGRPEPALAATEEAVALYRTLAAARPDAFTPDLATSLNNLGNMLSALGRPEPALAATEEAVALYRTLAAARPDAFTPHLATSLNNLGNMLSALGRPEPALAATEEAVALYRTLAAARPDAFTPDLAMSLNNLGTMLSALGRPEPALAATEEAVALYRTLAAARPDAFTPDLATSLGAHGSALRAAGRVPEAEAAFAEGVECIWRYFEQLPSAFARLTAALLRGWLQTIGDDAPMALTDRIAQFNAIVSRLASPGGSESDG